MAGVAAGWGAAPRALRSWHARLPHVVMASVMAFTLIGGSSPVKCLVGAAVLIVVSIAMAPLARTLPVFRLHLVDFWVMAVGMIVLVPHSGVAITAAHGHGGISVAAEPAFVAVVAVWAVTRIALIRSTPANSRRASAISAGLTVAALALMVVFCA